MSDKEKMSIRERMANCKLFTDFDPEFPEESRELEEARSYGKELTYDYNHTRPSETEKRMELIPKIFGKVGKDVWIEPPLHVAYGSNTTLGDNVYANFNLSIVDDYLVTIGNNVLFAPNVTISVTGHPLHQELRAGGEMYALPVVIEDNVWIGASVVICPGVTIGKGSVIGAGSVVTRSIPENSFAVGSPCRVLREITDRDKEYYYQNLRVDEQ